MGVIANEMLVELLYRIRTKMKDRKLQKQEKQDKDPSIGKKK